MDPRGVLGGPARGSRLRETRLPLVASGVVLCHHTRSCWGEGKGEEWDVEGWRRMDPGSGTAAWDELWWLLSACCCTVRP